MKEIKFECPHCAQRLDVPEEYLGETIACPACHGAIQFPESLPAAQNILDNVPPPTPERETKHCPYCAEEILEQARKCKHCGEILDHALRAERESVTPQSVQRNDHSPNTSPSVEKTEYEVHPAMFRNHPIAFLLCIVIPILGWLILFAWWIECLAIRLTITNKRTTLRKGIISK